jgi:hypothetical protein
MPKESHVEFVPPDAFLFTLPVCWLEGAKSSRNVSPGIHRITPVRLLYSARRARGT